MQVTRPLLDSPLKSVGGKRALRTQILAYLPGDAECYAEPFAGAAWVFFAKPPHPVEVLNDADGELVNLWRVMKWRTAELLEGVHHYLYSREFFEELCPMVPAHDEMARAVRYYLLLQMAFGADLSRSHTPSFGFRNKSPRDLFLHKSLMQFASAKERLRGVFIEHSDFMDVIHRYDQPRTIFYCDPPYLETAGYATAFTLEDHTRLATLLHSIEGRFLLTVNDHPTLRMLYRDMYYVPVLEARAKARAAEGRVAAPILCIANYRLQDLRAVGPDGPEQPLLL